MTKAAAYFLVTLREHLLAHGPAVRKQLVRLHATQAKKKLRKTQLSRWLHLQTSPTFDSALVLLRFAQMRGIITPGTVKTGLFIYAPPALVAPKGKHAAAA